MSQPGDIAIIVISAFAIPLAIGLPFVLIAWNLERSKIKRYMSERGIDSYRIALLKTAGSHVVKSRNKEQVGQMLFQFIPNGHFYVCVNSREPTELVFVRLDGLLSIHQLPSPELFQGKHLYRYRGIKCGIGTSIAWAALIWVLSIGAGLLVLAMYMRVVLYFGPTPLFNLIAPIVILEIVVIFLFLLPLWMAVRTFRRNRYENITTDRSLCVECGYDLTGNISSICPECGTAIKAVAEERA